jgi:hypothetical protein
LPASWTPEQIQRLDRSASIVASGVPSPLEVQRLVAAACEGGAAELAGLWETYQELASVVRETGGEGQRGEAALASLLQMLARAQRWKEISWCVERDLSGAVAVMLELRRDAGDLLRDLPEQAFLSPFATMIVGVLAMWRVGGQADLRLLEEHLLQEPDEPGWANMWRHTVGSLYEINRDIVLYAAALQRVAERFPEVRHRARQRRSLVMRMAKDFGQVLREALEDYRVEKGSYPDSVTDRGGAPHPWLWPYLERLAGEGRAEFLGGAHCLFQGYPGLRLIYRRLDSDSYALRLVGNGLTCEYESSS